MTYYNTNFQWEIVPEDFFRFHVTLFLFSEEKNMSVAINECL